MSPRKMNTTTTPDGVIKLEGYACRYNDEMDLIDDQLFEVLDDAMLAKLTKSTCPLVVSQNVCDRCTWIQRVVIGRIGNYEVRAELDELLRASNGSQHIEWLVSAREENNGTG